jgi:hypothetical protein
MERMKGFEPSTFCMASRRSSQLSYIRPVPRGARIIDQPKPRCKPAHRRQNPHRPRASGRRSLVEGLIDELVGPRVVLAQDVFDRHLVEGLHQCQGFRMERS